MANLTGPEHYQHAEYLLDMAGDDEPGSDVERYRVDAALVHASLARTALLALCHDDVLPARDAEAWRAAVTSDQPVPPHDPAGQDRPTLREHEENT